MNDLDRTLITKMLIDKIKDGAVPVNNLIAIDVNIQGHNQILYYIRRETELIYLKKEDIHKHEHNKDNVYVLMFDKDSSHEIVIPVNQYYLKYEYLHCLYENQI